MMTAIGQWYSRVQSNASTCGSAKANPGKSSGGVVNEDDEGKLILNYAL